MFFGINPVYKSNPNEMQLFKITLNKTFPLNIKDISLHYDIYNVSDNYIYFITYTKPVINTTPYTFGKIIIQRGLVFLQNHQNKKVGNLT